jgi:hypothetical protein
LTIEEEEDVGAEAKAGASPGAELAGDRAGAGDNKAGADAPAVLLVAATASGSTATLVPESWAALRMASALGSATEAGLVGVVAAALGEANAPSGTTTTPTASAGERSLTWLASGVGVGAGVQGGRSGRKPLLVHVSVRVSMQRLKAGHQA